MRALALFLVFSLAALPLHAQRPAEQPTPSTYLLAPDRVFDGATAQPHEGWVVLVRGDSNIAAGAPSDVHAPADARRIDLKGMTLLPGL
ncbi:MAG TPA: hypothetical protein VFS44_09840, partial [Gemmatimonadaceae bacterium]|nr:hypothetical protein [Gemmatimonadaceae bacterium]